MPKIVFQRFTNQLGFSCAFRSGTAAQACRERLRNTNRDALGCHCLTVYSYCLTYFNGCKLGGHGDFCRLCLRGNVAMLIGVISDTHGLLRPEALSVLAGSDHIVHAGDIGDPAILDKLAEIAPVTAVRGNVDRGAWAKQFPKTNVFEVGGVSIYVLHDLQDLDLKP